MASLDPTKWASATGQGQPRSGFPAVFRQSRVPTRRQWLGVALMRDQADSVVTFRFVAYNPRRHFRGMEAVQMEVIEDGKSCGLLWMSKQDIHKNISEFGESAALRQGLASYRKRKEVRFLPYADLPRSDESPPSSPGPVRGAESGAVLMHRDDYEALRECWDRHRDTGRIYPAGAE